MVQTVFAEIGYIQIRPAIVVVIAHRDTHAPAVVSNSSLLRYVSECAIVVVMEQRRMLRGSFAGKRFVAETVYKEDVEPSVIVIVQQCNSATERLNDKGF